MSTRLLADSSNPPLPRPGINARADRRLSRHPLRVSPHLGEISFPQTSTRKLEDAPCPMTPDIVLDGSADCAGVGSLAAHPLHLLQELLIQDKIRAFHAHYLPRLGIASEAGLPVPGLPPPRTLSFGGCASLQAQPDRKGGNLEPRSTQYGFPQVPDPARSAGTFRLRPDRQAERGPLRVRSPGR